MCVVRTVANDGNSAGTGAGVNGADVSIDPSRVRNDLAVATSSLMPADARITGNVSARFAANAGGVEIHGGTLTSDLAEWGTLTDNSPADISLTVDGRTYNYVGARAFTCGDGAGTGCL